MDSAGEENYKPILAEWLLAIELLAHGYKPVNLLIAMGQSPIFPPLMVSQLRQHTVLI
ncbi:hypothetical protein [Spirosoma foliorum]|uniref:Uncharacterized protein n=1 Tax=Spirosoma foliorum TaxID=2710596 RepID=A0A7G5H542_9BACT|nr:hypothetical protein [Spirosoma foliorum]QMW06234.1 hypothetical protein H3H32_15770 [Spirosoma foliorum]